MSGGFLCGFSEWLVFIFAVSLLYGSAEMGFRYGRRSAAQIRADTHPHVATIEGALLGLLALLLGFSFAMAVNRFDTRVQVVLEEANDIRTTFLRAQLLPQRYRAESARLLRDYVESRVGYYQAGTDPEGTRKALEWTETLHCQLWADAVAAERENPDEVTTGYFIASLNETIGDHTERVMSMENHVPEVVLWLLVLVASLTLAVTGYSSGLRSARLVPLRLILAILIAATLTVIVDLDRPRRGLIKVSEASMLTLRQELTQFTPPSAR